MHQKAYPLGGSLPTEREQPEQFIDLERLLAMGARRAKVIVLGAAVGLLLGVLYLVFTPSEYTAVTDVLIDESLAKYAQDTDNPAPLPSQIDALVLSEVEIMKSERLARTPDVARTLDNRIVYERNRRFLVRMTAIAAPNRPIFVAIGALHLGGPKGVLSLLRRRGFAVDAG